jgi:hypothetical protein
MRFKPAAIDQLARMICGDPPLPFPYRSSSDLTAFFTGLGLEHFHNGESRNPWVRDVLTSVNLQSAIEDDMPSSEMVQIIEELMNPLYFQAAKASHVSYDEATRRLNAVIKQYRFEVVQARETGLAQLRQINGTFVSPSKSERESIRKITFSPTVFNTPADDPQDDLVAVMMPFAAQFKPVYTAIQSACRESNLRCKRADDIWANSTIIQDIFDLIFVSSIVVVDFTGRNSNVMYETGVAHTLGKHVVPITQSMEDVPFDLQSHRVLKYLPNGEGLATLQSELSRRLATLVEGHSWSE